MPEQTYTITLTEAERKAVIGWADASSQGFHYGPAPDGWDEQPAQTASCPYQVMMEPCYVAVTARTVGAVALESSQATSRGHERGRA